MSEDTNLPENNKPSGNDAQFTEQPKPRPPIPPMNPAPRSAVYSEIHSLNTGSININALIQEMKNAARLSDNNSNE